jgi:hypothetical protein
VSLHIRFNWFTKDPMTGSCELGNKPTGFIRSTEFLDQMSNYSLSHPKMIVM